MVQRGTLFTWAEDNPGLAKYFVLTIKDKNGTVIAKAQTPASKPYYRVSAAFLKGLPPPDSLPYFNWSPPLPVVAKPVISARKASGGKRYAPLVQTASMVSGGAGAPSPPSPSASVKTTDLPAYIDAHLSETALTQLDLHGLGKAGNANATWQVEGFWSNPVTGQDEAVESSMALPLRLPAAPTGLFDCDAAAKGSSVALQSGGGGAAPVTGQPVLLSGTVDVSESPYRLTSPFYVLLPGVSHPENLLTTYDNVYVSWGDGEVDRLSVDRPESKATTIPIRRNGKPLNHVYGRAGTFQVKIYVVPDEQDQDPSSAAVYSSNSVYGRALRAYYAGSKASGGIHQGAGSAVPDVTIDASGGTSSGGGSLVTGHPGAGAAVSANAPSSIKLQGEDAYLLACATIEVEEPLDQTAYGPLHLKHVDVVFPSQAKSPPEVSDCSDAFTATARIGYYGMGKIALGWSVDGGKEIVQEPQDGIGPGKKSPLSQVDVQSPPLPASLAGSPHSLTVRVWVVSDAQASSVSGGGGGDPSGASAAGTSADPPAGSVTMTVMRPTQVSYSGIGSKVTYSGHPGGQGSSGGGTVLPFLFHVTIATPDRQVTSAPAAYKVVPHDPSVPCSITFPTRDGPFTISDIGPDYKQAGDGTWSGSGKLHLRLPEGTSGTRQVFVPVTFSGWTLSGSGGGTVGDGGTLDVSADAPVTVAGLTGKIAHVKGTAGHAQPLTITLSVTLSPFSGLKLPASVGSWNVTGPITPQGDFYKQGLSLGHAGLGVSGFGLQNVTITLDLSRSQGSQPAAGGCNPGGAGTAWIGLYIQKGTLKLNAFGRKFSSLPQPSIAGWSIGSSGLSGHLAKVAVNASAKWELATLKLDTLDFDVCSSSLSATYHLELDHVPVLNANLTGDLQIGFDGSVSGSLAVPNLEKNFGVIAMKVHNADFKNEAGVGWRLGMDVKFTLSAADKTFYTFNLNGLRVRLNGAIALKGGATTVKLPIGGKAALGPVQIDIQQIVLGLGTQSGNPYLEINFGGGFHLSSVLSVSVSHVKYRLVSHGSTMQGEGPFIDKVKVHAQFPDGPSPTVLLDVTVAYKHQGGRTVYAGSGHLSILNTGDIDAAFLLGYQNGQDYWMAKVGIPLGPTGVSLYPPYLTLYQIMGGLGHNVPLDALQKSTNLEDIQPSFDGSYSFMAGVRVGSVDKGFTYTFDGLLTIKTSPVAFRIDVKAWLLTGNHSGDGQLHGFIQYASKCFDAGLSGEVHALNDAVWVKAPSHACSIHFGPDGWHVYLGQNKKGMRLQAHVLVVNAQGWLMLDANGFWVGGELSTHLHYGGKLWGFGAHADVDFTQLMSLKISIPLHVRGEFSFSVSIEAGIDTPAGCLCVHPGVSLDLVGEAFPVSLCGTATIKFGKICWCVLGCCHTYQTSVKMCV